MRPAAKRCEPILDKVTRQPQFPRKPRCRPRLSRIHQSYLVGASAVLLALLLDACGAAQPRFGAGLRVPSVSPMAHESGDTSGVAADTSLDDDVQLDSAQREVVLAGLRDFTRERNDAFSNLDQSRLMREISKYMGVPYLLGGTSGEGLDCSAYTMLVYRQALKKELPRTSQEQAKVGSPVDFDDLKFGDLVFFNTTGEPASHVGIYLGDDLFAHASVSFGVTISSLQNSYYKKRFEQARRIIE
jgi:lipoprotein Spr